MSFNSAMYCQNSTESLEKAFGTFVSYLLKENYRAEVFLYTGSDI